MKRITLLAGALSVFMIAACKTNDNDMGDDRHAERQAGTGATAQRNYDDKDDSRGSAMDSSYGSSSHGGMASDTSPGSKAPTTAGNAGTAQRDFDDRHDSDESMSKSGGKNKEKNTTYASGTPGGATGSTATTTSQGYGGSTGPSSRTAGTAGTAQRDFDDRNDSQGMSTTQSSSSSRTNDRVAGTAGTSQRNYDDRDDSLGEREMDRQGRAGGTGVTEASARTRDNVNASTAIAGWPSVAQEAARAMIAKYGQPDEVTEDAVMWKNNGPWKKTVVHRMETEHNFPMPHKDVLEQKIEMRVPADKIDDLAEFDGSISVNRTKGTVAVVCDKEENNFVALNLANDIVTGKRSVEQARAMLAQTAMQVQNGQKPDIAQRLTFETTRGNAGDPDARFNAEATRNGSGVIDTDAKSKSSSQGTSTPPSKTQKDTRDLDKDDTIDKDHPNKPQMDEKPDKPGEEPDEKDDLDKPGF